MEAGRGFASLLALYTPTQPFPSRGEGFLWAP